MMTLEEYAMDVDKTIEEIFKMYKNAHLSRLKSDNLIFLCTFAAKSQQKTERNHV